jgi:2-polyprenyl-3-methyl-5-hydroxy-6-metoxy-1,4-benzoquinol methylase
MRPDSAIDFTHRASPSDLPEWMDEPCTYEDFLQCLRDLRQVNRLTLSYRPTLDFLDRMLAATTPRHPLRIVDVGSGAGDMLRRVQRWADHRCVAVTLTGIDLNPFAARAAKQLSRSDSAITWITGDAFAYKQPIDIVLSSLFTHHLESPEIVRFVAWSESVASCGWFINDLVREATPYKLFSVVSRLLRWHRFVQHDGPVSFRRAFREADWQRLLAEAGIPRSSVTLTRWTPGRLCVSRIKAKEPSEAHLRTAENPIP